MLTAQNHIHLSAAPAHPRRIALALTGSDGSADNIPLSECPAEFEKAFSNHQAAVADLESACEALRLLGTPTGDKMPD